MRKRLLESGAAGRRNRQERLVKAQAERFGQLASSMADAIDRTDDRIAALDHVRDPVNAVLETAIVMLELTRAGFGERAQMRNNRVSATDIEDAPTGKVWRGAGSRATRFFVKRV